MPLQPDRSWVAFWRTLIKFDSQKITPALALRNCVGVAIPIAIGLAMGQTAGGLIVSTGALNVCFSDGPEPYRQRGRRMLIASFLVALAIFAGGISGRNNTIAVLLAGAWAFAAGMLVALGTEAADLGVISLVTMVVFAAQSMHPKAAALSGLLALGGGLLQTALSLALWPIRRYDPERRELSALYHGLAQAAAFTIAASESPPVTAQMLKTQKALATLARDRTVEGERYRSLLAQAERIRLRMMVLSRLRVRIGREESGAPHGETLDRFLSCAARLLQSTGDLLAVEGRTKIDSRHQAVCMEEATQAASALRCAEGDSLSALVHDARMQVDALGGQLRSAADLAANATPAGLKAFEQREASRSWRLRLGGTFATLRAHLTFHSAAYRHAIRLALAVALGDAVGRSASLHRPYWIPMTIAIVLKPDFTSTFSRGVLRVGGTFAGLALATALFHVMAPTQALQVVLITIFVFILRWVGGANYAIFVAALSALVVLLIAMTGITPKEVIAPRAWNTAAGGALALIAYIAWPTWERTQVGESLALMLDGYRDYFRLVVAAYLGGLADTTTELDSMRQAARVTRSNAEASVDRVADEPGTTVQTVADLNAMLASSHRLVHAVMALEAGLANREPLPADHSFRVLAHHVELTLYVLAEALRGSHVSAKELPDLRADHQRLLTNRYELSYIETDRIVNSLNTLSEQVLRWVA